MDFPTSKFTTSRQLTYSFIHLGSYVDHHSSEEGLPAQPDPCILFLHGFPSMGLDFYPQITYLSSIGYRILAPDLIGYGSSSYPTESSAYRQKLIVQDIVELMDHLEIRKIVGISHDFGAQVLTRLEFYYPNRVSKMVFLTIGPTSLGNNFDLDTVNDMTRKMLGYEGFGYQDFLTKDGQATELLKERHEGFTALMYTSDHTLWKDYFGCLGGLKMWLVEDKYCEKIDAFNEELAAAHRDAFCADGRGYEGAKCWYLNFTNNVDAVDDRMRMAEMGKKRHATVQGRKVLLVLAGSDPIATPQAQIEMARSGMSDPDNDLIVAEVQAGHWVGLEKSTEVNEAILKFLRNN